MKTKKTETKKSITAKDKDKGLFANAKPPRKKSPDELEEEAHFGVQCYLAVVDDKEVLEDFKDIINEFIRDRGKKISKT